MITRIAPLFVAEISGNHNGSLSRALDLISAAKESGADLVKIQTYTPDSITLPLETGNFIIPKTHKLWGGRSLYSIYEEAHTPLEWHEELFNHANKIGIEMFSTPFDEGAVQYLEQFSPSCYKIASIEIVDLPLIEEVARTGKPIIISTGAASISDIDQAVVAARSVGNEDITLLVCTSAYPAQPRDANLARINALKQAFGVKVGLSDHTLGIGVSIAAIALGAEVIEKHLTLNRSDGGIDAAFSIEPGEFKTLTIEGRAASDSIGEPWSWNTESESTSHNLRPSLYVSKNVNAGDVISRENVKSVRPSGGLPPKEIGNVLGKSFKTSLPIGTPLSWDLFS